MRTLKILLYIIICGIFILLSNSNFAQATDQLIVVPAVVSDPSIPYVVHENAPITLKAILRNTTSTAGYNISWDVNSDGIFQAEETFFVAENAAVNGVRDIGRAFLTPFVTINQLRLINVKAVNLSNSNEVYGVFPILILNWTPDPNPLNWTEEQFSVLRDIAIQEDLWYLHRQLTNLGGAGVSNMIGNFGHANTDSHVLDLFVSNGRFPAYPPGTLNDYGYTLPTGWQASNDYRYNIDPYAETALRIMNYQLNTLSIQALDNASEDSTSGYDASGNEIYFNRIPGTTNNLGLKSSFHTSDGGKADGIAQVVTGFSKALPALFGIPVQTGASGVAGNAMEYVCQEIIDYIVYHQIDGGTGLGGFYYDPFNGSSSISMGEPGAGVARGLWASQRLLEPYGLIVNNKLKYRMAENVYNQQGSDDLVKRFGHTSGSNHNFNYTGGYLGICQWLGIDKFIVTDDTIAFPGYCTKTRGELKSAYDDYLTAAIPLWTSGTKLDPNPALDHFWENGDFMSGNYSGVFNQTLGSTFNMFQWIMGLSNSWPVLDSIGTHDWLREMNIHLLRGQERMDQYNTMTYGIMGRFADDYCTYFSHSCQYNPPLWSSVLAGRSLTAINHLGMPLALAVGLPEQVAVGDSVSFIHSGSQTLRNLAIIEYRWDADISNGLWWETGATADFTAHHADSTFKFAYTSPGTYTACLFVSDNLGWNDTATISVTVTAPLSSPGNCLLFDGDSGWVHTDESNDLKPAGPFTLEAWVYVDSTVTNAAIIDNGFATGESVNHCSGFNLGVHSDTSKRFVFWACNGTDYPDDLTMITSQNEYEEDEWNHVAAAYSGSELILYVNGVEEARTPFSGTIAYTYVEEDQSYGLNIGCFKDDDEENVFKGMIDEVRIWGDERNSQEIADYVCRPLSGSQEGLKCYYRFDYTSGAVTMDDFSPSDNFGFLQDMDTAAAWVDSEAFTTWIGTTDTIWLSAANWTDGVPATSENAGVAPSENVPFITESDTCRILSVSSGASLIIHSDSLIVSRNILNAGQLTVQDTLFNIDPASNFINHGTLSNEGIMFLRRLVNEEGGSIILETGKQLIIEGE